MSTFLPPIKSHYCQREGQNICRQGKPPRNAECDHFFQNNNGGVSEIPSDKNEIMIVHQNGQATYCFKEVNPENPEYGWCRTSGNYYDAENPVRDSRDERQWGYCSKDCYLDTTKTVTTLRILDQVQVTSRHSPTSVLFVLYSYIVAIKSISEVRPCHLVIGGIPTG